MSESASGEASSSNDSNGNSSSAVCRICGEECKNNLGLSTHFRYKHPNEHRIPHSKLERLYADGLSMREIADKLDTSKGSIQVAFEKYGLEARDSYRDDSYPPRHRFDKISERVGHEYEVMETSINYDSYSFFIHRLIAVANEKLDPGDFRNFDIIVHHESGHGLDNRPSNLRVMDRGDHQSMHVKERHKD